MAFTQHVGYGDVLAPLKMYLGENCGEVYWVNRRGGEAPVCNIYTIAMTELTKVLMRKLEGAEKCHISLKGFNNNPENKKVRNHCHYTGLYCRAAHRDCNLKCWMADRIPIVF